MWTRERPGKTDSLPNVSVTDLSTDPTIRRLREQISNVDHRLVEAINTRLRLVSRLKHYKTSRGLDFVDPEREQWIVRDLLSANRGPLSPEGVREIVAAVLDLTKREVSRDDEWPQG